MCLKFTLIEMRSWNERIVESSVTIPSYLIRQMNCPLRICNFDIFHEVIKVTSASQDGSRTGDDEDSSFGRACDRTIRGGGWLAKHIETPRQSGIHF